ncbi:MAG: DUF1028 domain-containing protein [Planctomycetes bacterium]|nr:DUF1028 domain-containing protein [Planctomycetota bacterium]
MALVALVAAAGPRWERTAPAEGAARDLPPDQVGTFSIVAYDPQRKEWGVAVQSCILAVGSMVPFARSEVGAIATQAYANTTFGPRGLDMLADGHSAEEVVKALIQSDHGRERRQLAVIDKEGRLAHYTGKDCTEWAGAVTGEHYSCQGNILAGPQVVQAMTQAFEKARGSLADRMLAALEAGQQAGGDRRGQQSAAMLVVKKGAGWNGFDDRFIDLRVDDHPSPIAELKRLVNLRLGRSRSGG